MATPNSIQFSEIEEVYKACGIDPADDREVKSGRTLSDFPLQHKMPSMFKDYKMTFSSHSNNFIGEKP